MNFSVRHQNVLFTEMPKMKYKFSFSQKKNKNKVSVNTFRELENAVQIISSQVV